MQKLRRVVKYLRKTKDLGMALEPSKTLQVYAWIDASFGVHDDLKSHSGIVVGIGKGPTFAKSCVQKLNTSSSCEAEVVAVSDGLGQLLWTREFMQHQAYVFEPDGDGDTALAELQEGASAVLFQDNQAAIVLHNGGASKRSSRTRHIAIRYFHVRDKVLKRQVEVRYCPTDDMVADILTKPLGGDQFERLRALLLNWH
jgi:hypothetical protein